MPDGKKKVPLFQVQRWALAAVSNAGLSKTDAHVLVVLSIYGSNPDRFAYPGKETMVAETSLGLSTIYQALAELQRRGLIQKRRLRGRDGFVLNVDVNLSGKVARKRASRRSADSRSRSLKLQEPDSRLWEPDHKKKSEEEWNEAPLKMKVRGDVRPRQLKRMRKVAS